MTNPFHGENQLRAELIDLADGYRPDKAAIANRAATRRAAKARRDRKILPVAAATAVLVVAGSIVAVQQRDEPDPTVIAATGPPVATTEAPTPSSKPTKRPPATKEPAPPDFLTSGGVVDAHSVATWTQNTVTLRTTEPASAVEVTITMSLTEGASPAGSFTTAPNSDIATRWEHTSDALVCHLTLKDGADLKPGTYVFAAQFNHAADRGQARDSYVVTAHTAGGTATDRGEFKKN